jgi:hypothetical protein
LERAESDASKIRSLLAILAFPSANLGREHGYAHHLEPLQVSTTAGWRIMLTCIAGATMIGMPAPIAVVASDVTACRLFRMRSCLRCWRWQAAITTEVGRAFCSAAKGDVLDLARQRRHAGFPVAHSMRSGDIIDWEALE